MNRPIQYEIEMRDGSVWAMPVEVIARHRAEHYKDEFGDDVERSLEEDTWPLFEENDYEVSDWAVNNMDWDDVVDHAKQISKPEPLTPYDFQEGWMNGNKEVV